MVLHEPTKRFAHSHSELMIIPMVGTIVLICVIACCENLRRQSPINVILLGAFTLMESLMVGFISSTYKPKIVSSSKHNRFNFQMCNFKTFKGSSRRRFDSRNCCRLNYFCLPNKIRLHCLWGSVMHRAGYFLSWKYHRWIVLPFGIRKLLNSLLWRRSILYLHRL